MKADDIDRRLFYRLWLAAFRLNALQPTVSVKTTALKLTGEGRKA